MQIPTFRIAVIAALACLAAACNTVAGIGKDLGAIGDALTGASEDAQGQRLEGGPSR